jgi:hypothetical protein
MARGVVLFERHETRLSRLSAALAGADVDVQDPEGYTPLHMAAGYLHVESVEELLKGGADITRSDRSGRDVRTLVDSLRERMTSANAINQRMRLEQVCWSSASSSCSFHSSNFVPCLLKSSPPPYRSVPN